MHTTGMLMRGHRSMEGLSYVSKRLETRHKKREGGYKRNEKALL
jgi:hypothetical protein